MTQQQRDAIALTKIEQFLDNQVDDESAPIDRRLAASKIRYDKLRPALSAVEQTNINPEESLSEEQIMLKIQALIAAHPDLVARAQAMAANKPQECGVNTETAPQQGNNPDPSIIRH